MLVPALLLLTLIVGGVILTFRRKVRRSSPSLQPAQSDYFSEIPTRERIRAVPRALEVAHASRSGALALSATGKARVRPGHRCVEEVRRRCHLDFVGAMNFLEGQLNRRVSSDALEQSRYWIDLAEGLRGLNLHESLPALLRRADDALDMPLAEGYAAEVSSFAAFAEYLHDPLTPEGQSALRVLRVAMEGVRLGKVQATVYADAAFGDAVRRLSENCPDVVNPRLVLAFIEGLRHARRSFHNNAAFRDDPVRRQTVRWQQAFLRDAEPIMREYLHDIGPELARLLENTRGRARREILLALAELQVDTDDVALILLGDPEFADRAAAIKCLRWSKSPLAPAALCGIARHALTGERSARWLRRLGVGKKPVPADEAHAALRALRGHPSEEAERVLLNYARRPEAAWRRDAFRSLGWWEPMRRGEVLYALRTGRQDPHPDVRRAALAAAARLGECAALQMLREMLARETPAPVLDAIRLSASEGLSWLWPELDVLTESDDAAIAAEAWESIEQLREEFLGPLG
ncbi:MAG TPA: HEAT repeat domain-containing protein [Gemmataceae bacterium]|nr:HEAT repeat domain-containing protein [Gemmataceae bacterium]